MSFYLRFISEDKLPSVPELVERWSGLETLRFSEVDASSATIEDDSGVIAAIEVNRPGDGLFEEELSEMRDDAESADGDKSDVFRVLDTAQSTLAFEVLTSADGLEASVSKLGPLFEWVPENFKGLIHADGEGFYRGRDLVLDVG